ncbi:MAG: tetratricopeptide repeat protein [Bacteroidetes bacterium]|nr:tetratricopeptide repeat protein [Bacteroidota bacterium]MBU1718627.1 tetratricopeptide repeat protein [Bacteroidota bacterium]
MNIRNFLIVLNVAIVSFFHSYAQKTANEWNQSGDDKYKTGNLKGSVSDFSKAISIGPETPEFYTNRGRSLALLESYDKALADFSKAIALDSTYSRAWYNRAFVKYQLADYQGAEFDNTQSIKHLPENKSAYNNRGNCRHQQKKTQEALSDYTKAISLDPAFTMAYSNRGNLYMETGKIPDALTDYNKALEIDSNYAGAWYNKGLLYDREKDYKTALYCYNRAIALDQEEADFYLSRSLVRFYLGDIKGAKSDNKTTRKLDKDVPRLELNPAYSNEELINHFSEKYYEKGENRMRKSEYKQALRFFNKAIELKPEWADPFLQRGLILISIDRKEEGCSDLEKAAALGNTTAITEQKNLCR